MKKVFKYLIVLLVVLLPVLGVDAASKKKTTTTTTTTTTAAGKKVNFYLFYGSTCPHCLEMHEYLAELVKDPTINYMFDMVEYEVWGNEENNFLMLEVAEELGYNTKKLGVPFYVIGEEHFNGYAESYKSKIRDAIEKAYKNTNTKDIVGKIAEEIKNGDRNANESKKNRTVGFVILGITAIAVIAILFSKNNSSYYSDDEDDDDEDDDDDEEVEEKKAVDKKEVKKTTTKNTTTKKKTNTKKKN